MSSWIEVVYDGIRWRVFVNNMMNILVQKKPECLDQVDNYKVDKEECTMQVVKETTVIKIADKHWMDYKLPSFCEYSQVSRYFKRK